MHLDEKVTIWIRHHFNDDVPQEIIDKAIESNDMSELKGYSDETEYLYDCDGYVTLEQNNGFSTEELCNDGGDLIWQNGK